MAALEASLAEVRSGDADEPEEKEPEKPAAKPRKRSSSSSVEWQRFAVQERREQVARQDQELAQAPRASA